MVKTSATERHEVEQLADSFMLAYRAGKCPNLDDFIRQYPHLADQLRDVIDALILLERNAPGRAQFEAAHAHVPFSARVPREIGDFAIVREIGRGGMGVVYEAVQQSLGRPVALKVLSAAGLLSPIQLERFRLEARSAAQLHHNHIVPVYGVGQHKGIHFYAMQFIHGQSLNQVIEALRELRGRVDDKKPELTARDEFTHAITQGLVTGDFAAGVDGTDVPNGENSDRQPIGSQATPHSPLTTSRSSNEFTSGTYGRPFYESVARVGLEVADALAYAHGEGVLHRDIKPSNLLLDGKGSVWITDFGLAKTEGADGLTETGDFVGTLRYMAPERLEGWSDRRSDIYSLGATLYELLTLRSFFEGGSRAQMIDRIVHERPTPPTKVDPSIPRDLETIVLKAIAKEPPARYRTADEMAEDLRRYLSDRPILARRSTHTERFVRWCRRNPLVATLAACVLAALTIGLAATSYFAASASREAENVKAALAQAELNHHKAEGVNKFFTEEVFGMADPNRHDRAGIKLVDALDIAAGEIDSHFPDDPALRAEIRDQFGQIYSSIDKPQKAIEQLRQAIELRRKLASDQDPSTMKSRRELGYALFKASHFNESREVLESVWADQSKILGAGDAEAVETAHFLALVLMEIHGEGENLSIFPSVGDRDLEVSREAYQAALARLGPHHAATLKIESMLGWVLRWRHSHKEAMRYAQEAALGLRNIQGDDNVETLFARYNYACCLFDLDRCAEAATEMRQVLDARTRLLGPTHFDSLCAAWQLTLDLTRCGKQSEALHVIEGVHGKLSEIKELKTPLRAQKMLDFAGLSLGLKEYSLASDFLSASDEIAAVAPDDENQHRNYAKLLNDIAAQMIAFPNSNMRYAPRAVELSTKACELTEFKNPGFLETLATAYEKSGDEREAAKTRETVKAIRASQTATKR